MYLPNIVRTGPLGTKDHYTICLFTQLFNVGMCFIYMIPFDRFPILFDSYLLLQNIKCKYHIFGGPKEVGILSWAWVYGHDNRHYY